MIGRGDGEQRAQDFEGGTARQVEVEARKVVFPIYRLHIALLHHRRKNGLHSRQCQRQERTAMGHDHFQVRVAHKHVPCQHIHHGAGGLRRIFVHSQRCGGDDFFRIRRGAVWMDDDDGVTLVQHFHQRVQLFVAQVLPPAVGRQLHTVRAQGVERIDGFTNGGIHIGQWQGGAEPEPIRILPLHLRRNLIHPADTPGTFLRNTVIRLRGRHGQHGGTDACTVHEGDMPLRTPCGQRECLFQLRPVRFQHFHVFGDDDVGMDIKRLSAKGNGAERHSRKQQSEQSHFSNRLYSSSVTGSSHSLEEFSPGTSKARCANQLSAAAPCQCFTLAGMWTTSPGSICTAGLPSS